jgi:hypothetical protein
MAFRYAAGDTDESLGGDARQALEAFTSAARVVLIALLYLLPWMLAAFGIALGLRWVRRRFFSEDERRGSDGKAAATPPAES